MSTSFVKHLIIYPIKSLGPIFKDVAEIGPQGLKGDREMMLIDSNGKFITQRTKKDLVRFKLKVYNDTFNVIDRWGNQEKIIDVSGFNQFVEKVEIWDDHVNQVLVHSEMSEWFSEILQEDVRLVKMNADFKRTISEKHVTDYSHNTSFADSLPILLCTTASLEKVEEDFGSFDYLRFRPNIVLKNEIPFEEDEWKSIEIDSVNLSAKKRCARCNLITVDPQSGEVDKTFLGKLSSYRTTDSKVFFGVQFVPSTGGTIQVGAEIISR